MSGGGLEFLFLITAQHRYQNYVDELVRQQRIQELAREIWEAEGRPDGHSARHWAMAERLVEAEILAAGQCTDGVVPILEDDKGA